MSLNVDKFITLELAFQEVRCLQMIHSRSNWQHTHTHVHIHIHTTLIISQKYYHASSQWIRNEYWWLIHKVPVDFSQRFLSCSPRLEHLSVEYLNWLNCIDLSAPSCEWWIVVSSFSETEAVYGFQWEVEVSCRWLCSRETLKLFSFSVNEYFMFCNNHSHSLFI